MSYAMYIVIALLALIPASYASAKERSFVGWWFYGFLLFPVALIHSLVIKPVLKPEIHGERPMFSTMNHVGIGLVRVAYVLMWSGPILGVLLGCVLLISGFGWSSVLFMFTLPIVLLVASYVVRVIGVALKYRSTRQKWRVKLPPSGS